MQSIIVGMLELWGLARFQQFSSIMYDERLYTTPFWVMLITPIILCFVFYKARDAVRGASIGRWAMYGLGSALLVLLINFLFLNSKNTNLQLGFIFADMFSFLIINVLWSLLIYFVVSLFVKYLSINRRYIPF